MEYEDHCLQELSALYAAGGMDKYLRHWPKVTQYTYA
jgi:hypothetical protein